MTELERLRELESDLTQLNMGGLIAWAVDEIDRLTSELEAERKLRLSDNAAWREEVQRLRSTDGGCNCMSAEKLASRLEQEVSLLTQRLDACSVLARNALVFPFVDHELIEGRHLAYCAEYGAVRKVVLALLEFRAENQRLQLRLNRADYQLGNLKFGAISEAQLANGLRHFGGMGEPMPDDLRQVDGISVREVRPDGSLGPELIKNAEEGGEG